MMGLTLELLTKLRKAGYDDFSASTESILVWFIDKHKLFVEASPYYIKIEGDIYHLKWQFSIFNLKEPYFRYEDNINDALIEYIGSDEKMYDSYKEAMYKGFEYIIDNITLSDEQ